MCIYSDKHAFINFIVLLSSDRKLFVCVKRQKFNLEDINGQIKQWFGTVGWFVQQRK